MHTSFAATSKGSVKHGFSPNSHFRKYLLAEPWISQLIRVCDCSKYAFVVYTWSEA